VRLLGSLTVLLALCASFAIGQTPSQGFAGGEVCKTCHPDVWLNFYKNPHYKSIAAGNLAPERTGCEGCHGPGKAHVEARGGKTTIPRAFSLMQPREVLNACLACHSEDITKAQIERSSHTLSEVVCSDCHSIHKPRTPKFLLAKVQRDVCYGCHANVRSQFSMPSKHRVNEGVIECTDCHNPHGSSAGTWRMGLRPRMVEQGQVNEEPCLKCHSDKRGPFVFEHPSVRVDGCETCHNPHGSMNARLLRRPVVFTLCLECHNGAPGFGPREQGIPTQSATHDMTSPRYQNCTTCHVRIHGSNADPLFLR
jgi:DmsE family decaheme c-type cytochrome